MALNTIFFIGPQGSGKGTQAKLLASKLNFFHWDNGSILRETAKKDTVLGRQVKDLVDKGIYLPDDLLMQVAEEKLNSIAPEQGVIFDGIPRRQSQAEFILNFLKIQGRNNFVTIFLNLPKEKTLERLLNRAMIEGRADDNKEAIEKRLDQYYKETLPVLEYLKQNTTFFEIDGSPKVEEVTAKINDTLLK